MHPAPVASASGPSARRVRWHSFFSRLRICGGPYFAIVARSVRVVAGSSRAAVPCKRGFCIIRATRKAVTRIPGRSSVTRLTSHMSSNAAVPRLKPYFKTNHTRSLAQRRDYFQQSGDRKQMTGRWPSERFRSIVCCLAFPAWLSWSLPFCLILSVFQAPHDECN